ncbi:MAG TPA: DNA methyltransferase [Sumerlaeia bacterium]|nr:DNA methyltransferase [Sumerlaeia bacterium]
MGSWKRTERLAWAKWATPKQLREEPIHRWFVFPHSYSGELVKALIDEWGLGPKDCILDPFVGAGTTLVAAKEKGVPANGYDLSPLAVLVSRVKSARYSPADLRKTWTQLKRRIDPNKWNRSTKHAYPELVVKALPGRILVGFDNCCSEIRKLEKSAVTRDFFFAGLLACIHRFSRAVPTGGWLKWVAKEIDDTALPDALGEQVALMLDDVESRQRPHSGRWSAAQSDARHLPKTNRIFSAAITSPPYPNRHDYTRIFGVELMFGFLNWEEIRSLRHRSVCSHPESHPIGFRVREYETPRRLDQVLKALRCCEVDPRVTRMLFGYFSDMFSCLQEIAGKTGTGAHIAAVVGNVQYAGVPVMVDELIAEIGEQVGLLCEEVRIIRYRGNSAQQMGRYGRRPSRESVVIFRKIHGA